MEAPYQKEIDLGEGGAFLTPTVLHHSPALWEASAKDLIEASLGNLGSESGCRKQQMGWGDGSVLRGLNLEFLDPPKA